MMTYNPGDVVAKADGSQWTVLQRHAKLYGQHWYLVGSEDGSEDHIVPEHHLTLVVRPVVDPFDIPGDGTERKAAIS
jgi:hypothetical protein